MILIMQYTMIMKQLIIVQYQYKAYNKFTGYVEGDVLVSRNPCHAPWDVQKLRALGYSEVFLSFIIV